MSHDEIVGFWGRENLRRWPRHLLTDVAIPEASKRFLAEVGLPPVWGSVEFGLGVVGGISRLDEARPHSRAVGSHKRLRARSASTSGGAGA